MSIKKYLDLMDAFSLRLERKVKLQKTFRFFWRKEFHRILHYEQTIHTYFDRCFIISQIDKDYLKSHGIANLTILSNGVDTGYFSPNSNVTKRYDLAFVGNLSYEPNIVAAKYLANRILPHLKKLNPKIRVLICGSNPKKEIINLKSSNLDVKVNVPDIRDAYRQSKIFVAPIFLGSGMQNKILEAMACGLPCVTSPQVIEAIGIPNEFRFPAENAADFIHLIQKLLKNEDLEMLGKLSRKFVVEKYSWHKNNQNLSILDINYGKGVPIK